MVRPAVLIVAVLACGVPAGARSLPPAKGPTGLPRRASDIADTACSAYGPGFRRLGDSDACVKIGGSVRVETSITSGGSAFAPRARP